MKPFGGEMRVFDWRNREATMLGHSEPLAYILLSERIIEEPNGLFSAFCDELGSATFGESHDKALDRLQKANLLLLNEATKNGDLNDLLEGRGILLRHFDLSTASSPHRFEASETHFGYGNITHRPYNFALAG